MNLDPQKCKNCGHENAPLKKTCENCHKVLEGFCINNVTGEYGYRDEKGMFHVQPENSRANLKRYRLTIEKTRNGKVLDVTNVDIESSEICKPKTGQGNALLTDPPIIVNIIEVEDLGYVWLPATEWSPSPEDPHSI